MTGRPSVTLAGTVEKIIKPSDSDQAEKAQIAIEGADDLYKEIRIKNALTDKHGRKVGLKKGGDVEVTVEADPEATHPKKKAKRK